MASEFLKDHPGACLLPRGPRRCPYERWVPLMNRPPAGGSRSPHGAAPHGERSGRISRRGEALASPLLPFARLFILGLLVTAFGCGNSWAEPNCRAEPVGWVTVFLEQSRESRSIRLSGTIVESEAPDDLGLRHYLIEDVSGARQQLTYGAPTDPPPLEQGRTCELQVDYVPGMPSPNGILVHDDKGFLFAAASDYGPGDRVLQEGVPGFRIKLVPSDCPNRSRNKCFESIVNIRLSVEYAGETVVLFQGQSARLGPYRVACLLAQDVIYSDTCADAGMFRVAYTITRVSG